MKRWIFKLVVFLLLGAVLNVAFAHYFWWYGEEPPPFDPSTFDPVVVEVRARDVEVWHDRGGFDWPDPPQIATETRYFGVTYRGLHWIGPEDHEDTNLEVDFESYSHPRSSFVVDIIESGWPMRCIASESWWEMHGSPKPFAEKRGYRNVFGYELPSRVVWPGFAINTVFYAAILWVLTLGPFTARRVIRRKRGRCNKCGYDLRGAEHEVCPECGWQMWTGKAGPRLIRRCVS